MESRIQDIEKRLSNLEKVIEEIRTLHLISLKQIKPKPIINEPDLLIKNEDFFAEPFKPSFGLPPQPPPFIPGINPGIESYGNQELRQRKNKLTW